MSILFIHNMGGGAFLIFGLFYLVIWVYCLVDILKSNYKDPNMKLIWIIILLFAQVIGALVYLAIGKSTKANL